MSEPPHDPDLTAVERALAGLTPSAGQLNRDALLFAAGRRSLRRGWAWPCAATAASLAAAILAALLFLRPEPGTVVRFVPVPSAPVETAVSPPDERSSPPDGPPTASASPLRPDLDYLTVWHQVERWGDAGLPPTRLAPTSDDRPAAAIDPLDLPPDLQSDPWLQRSKAMLTPGGAL